jgi:hypothetical protein
MDTAWRLVIAPTVACVVRLYTGLPFLSGFGN